MFASINSADFCEITVLARSVISKSSTLAILQCIRLTVHPASPRLLTAVATDLDITITRQIALAEPAVPGIICVPVAALLKIRPDKGSQVIVHQWDQLAAAVTSTSFGARAVHHVELHSAADFPPDSSMLSSDCSLTILPAATLEALAASLPFQSQDDTRYVLNGCLIEPTALVACDGRRLVRFNVRGTPVPIIVPRKTCQLIAQLKPSLATARITMPDSSTLSLHFGADLTLHSKLIEGNYPNYRQVLPAACHSRITFADPGPVIRFLRHLDHRTRQPAVHVTPLPPWQLELRHADATFVTAAHFTGTPCAASFNPRFLADCIETVGPTFSQEDCMAPALFSSPSASGVLMAMRNCDPPACEANATPLPDAA